MVNRWYKQQEDPRFGGEKKEESVIPQILIQSKLNVN